MYGKALWAYRSCRNGANFMKQRLRMWYSSIDISFVNHAMHTLICNQIHRQFYNLICIVQLKCIKVRSYFCSCKSFSDDHAQHAHYCARCFIHSWNVHPACCVNKTRPKNFCRDNSVGVHRPTSADKSWHCFNSCNDVRHERTLSRLKIVITYIIPDQPDISQMATVDTSDLINLWRKWVQFLYLQNLNVQFPQQNVYFLIKSKFIFTNI